MSSWKQCDWSLILEAMSLSQPPTSKPYKSYELHYIESGYQYLGNGAFLDILLFMRSVYFRFLYKLSNFVGTNLLHSV